jgi:hypothetical protein
MKSILLVAASASLLSACVASGPATAWGKAGVSKVQYVTDLGTCTGVAAMQETGNGANTAGGVNGQNGSRGAVESTNDPARAGASQAPPGTAMPTGGGGMYRDSAPPDVVNRATNQQQSQAMAAQRIRAEALKSCFVEHGYQEFKLSPEQRQHLGSLKPGTNEYLLYLAEIGADPKSQPASK